MMSRIWLLWVSMAGLLAWQCGSSDCLKSRGDEAQTYRPLQKKIWAIKLYEDVDLLLLDSAETWDIKIQTGQNLLNDIKTDYVNIGGGDTVLSIHNAARCNWVRKLGCPPKLSMRYPAPMQNIYHYGWGKITNTGVLNLSAFTLTMYSAATNTLRLNCPNLRLDFNGTGKIEIKGRGNYLFIWARKYPDIRLDSFQTSRCDFYLDSSKDIHLCVKDSIKGQIDGSGNVFVYGRPHVSLSPKSKGGGRIILR